MKMKALKQILITFAAVAALSLGASAQKPGPQKPPPKDPPPKIDPKEKPPRDNPPRGGNKPKKPEMGFFVLIPKESEYAE